MTPRRSLLAHAFVEVLGHVAAQATHAAEQIDRVERTRESAEIVAATQRFAAAVEGFVGARDSSTTAVRP